MPVQVGTRSSPGGTAETSASFGRPFGTCRTFVRFSGVQTPGYFHFVPPGHTFGRAPNGDAFFLRMCRDSFQFLLFNFSFLTFNSWMLKRTALFSAHQKLGGKLIEFGGWEMPVQYTSITDEHLAVRNAAGIFDISHMGEVTVSGASAAEFLNSVLTNDIRKLASGEGQYTLMCNERGGVVDDLYVYRLSESVYFLIINAARIEADVAWMQAQAAKFPRRSELRLTDASHQYAAVAVQGPRVKEFMDACIAGGSNCALRVGRVTDLKKNQIGGFPFDHGNVMVSRTGYTGEDGFEIVGSDEAIQHVWNKILEIGQPFGIKPCGLGARDTLRTELCYPLYGHELDENTTPIEAGVGFFVAL